MTQLSCDVVGCRMCLVNVILLICKPVDCSVVFYLGGVHAVVGCCQVASPVFLDSQCDPEPRIKPYLVFPWYQCFMSFLRQCVTNYISFVNMTVVKLTCRHPKHPYVGSIWTFVMFTCHASLGTVWIYGHRCKLCQNGWTLTFSISTKMSEHMVPHHHFEIGCSSKQAYIRDNLNLYLFQMNWKTHRFVKITTVNIKMVIIAWAVPSSSCAVDDRKWSVKVWCSDVVCNGALSVLYTWGI